MDDQEDCYEGCGGRETAARKILERRKKQQLKKSLLVLVFGMALALLGEQVVGIERYPESYVISEETSPIESFRTEGQQFESGQETFARLDGTNGMELILSMPSERQFSYTVMFWWRSAMSLAELRLDDSILDSKAFLFEFPGSASCYVTRSSSVEDVDGGEPVLVCTPGDSFKIKLSELPDIQSWMHLTYSTEYVHSASFSTYVLVNNVKLGQDRTIFPQMYDYRAYLGAGIDLGNGNRQGLPGDYREFFFSLGYVEESKVALLKNQQKALNFDVRALYLFDQVDDRYADAYRAQSGRPIGETEPSFIYDPNIKEPLCNPLPANLVRIPTIDKPNLNLFGTVNIPNFLYEQRSFGYTVSMWIKNTGKHTYSSSAKVGRNSHHMFEIADAFALWLDSENSFRVYVFAAEDYDENISERVYLPLNAWINVQVTVSATEGITAMTFNQNGQLIQLVNDPTRLGPQVPDAKMKLFGDFTGTIYTLEVWQRYMKIPVNPNASNIRNEMIASYNFHQDYNEQIGSWDPSFGPTLATPATDTFDWISDKVPSNVDYANPKTYGALDTEETQYNGIDCSASVDEESLPNMMHFNGRGSGLSFDVFVTQTVVYTVEFWFKADTEKAFELDNQEGDVTQLFTMVDGLNSAMTIYVKDGLLYCSPFGRDKGYDLVYDGIRPLTESRWQHISCIFSNEHWVKGTYLAIDIDQDVPSPDLAFEAAILKPLTFALTVTDSTINNPNVLKDNTWTVVLGNSLNFPLVFYGSLKDVRLWSSIRTDAELYSYRFRQVKVQDDLKANFKLMDDKSYVLNDALGGQQDLSQAVEPNNIDFVTSDGTNLICPFTAFFDPRDKTCASFPYQSDISSSDTDADDDDTPNSDVLIVYTTQKNQDGTGYEMNLSTIAQTTMLLPGPDNQPKVTHRWTIDDANLQNDAVDGDSSESFSLPLSSENLDPYTDYSINLLMQDELDHSFYIKKEQLVRPIACYRVVDSETDEPVREITRTIGQSNPVEDLCFNFEVKKDVAEECNIYSGVVRPVIDFETRPQLQDDVLSRLQPQFNPQSNSFRVCIPGNTIKDDIPQNRPLSVVFTVYFDRKEDETSAYMNVVYKVMLTTEIMPRYSFDRNVIEIESTSDDEDEEVSQDLSLSSTTSFFNYIVTPGGSNTLEQSDGLTFNWICSGSLSDYCAEWAGLPILHIPADKVKDVDYNEFVTIQLVVTALELSYIDNPDSPVTFSVTDQFIWSNEEHPEFEIVKSDNGILVTKPNQLTIKPENFLLGDPNLRYTFRLTPADKIDSSLVKQSAGRSVLTIAADALQFSTDYKLDVQIIDAVQTETKTPGQQVFFFRTNDEPQASVAISPDSGEEFKTEFQVSFESESTLSIYEAFGIKEQVEAEDQKIPLLPEIGVDSTATLTLPDVSKLEIVLEDENGELVSVETGPVTITSSQVIDGSFIDEQITSNDDSPAQLLQNGPAMITKAVFRSDDEVDEAAQEAAFADAQDVNGKLAAYTLIQIDEIELDSVQEEDQKVVGLAVNTLAEMSQYTNFMTDATVEESISTIDTIDSLDTFSQVVKDDNRSFTVDYVKLLGNLIEVQAERTDLTQSGRMLQGSGLSPSVSSLLGAKSQLLDVLCEEAELDNQLGKRVEGDDSSMEVFVEKLSADSTRKEAQYVSRDGRVQFNVPFDKLLQQQEEAFPGFEYLCIQVSMMRFNPVPSNENRAFIEGGYTAQISTVDDQQNRLFDSQALQATASEEDDETVASLYFLFDDTFVAGKTFCMHVDPSETDTKTWSASGCTAELFNESQPKIRCSCDEFDDGYYAIVTDTTVRVDPEVGDNSDKDREENEKPSDPAVRAVQERKSVGFILMAVLIPLVLIGCLLPCLAVQLDDQDYREVEQNQYNLDSQLLAKFEKARGKSCIQEVYFTEKELKKYVGYSYLGCCQAFGTFNRTIHPLFSIFQHYDFKMSRMGRLSLLLIQVSIITILTWLAYTEAAQDKIVEILGEDETKKMLVIAAVLSVLTIPLPRRFFCCLERQLYVFREQNLNAFQVEASREKMMNQSLARDPSPAGTQTYQADPSEINLDFDHGGETSTEVDEQSQAALMDTRMKCKKCFIVLIYLIWLIAIAFSVLVMLNVHEVSDFASDFPLITDIELDNDQAWQLVSVWYLATFGFGWLGLNEIRIILVSILAPCHARGIFRQELQDSTKDEAVQHTPSGQVIRKSRGCSCLTCLLIPPQSVEISLDALYMIDIKANPGKYETFTQAGKGSKKQGIELSSSVKSMEPVEYKGGRSPKKLDRAPLANSGSQEIGGSGIQKKQAILLQGESVPETAK